MTDLNKFVLLFLIIVGVIGLVLILSAIFTSGSANIDPVNNSKIDKLNKELEDQEKKHKEDKDRLKSK